MESCKGNFNHDIFKRNSYDGISKGWGCEDEWTVLKKDGVDTPWVTGAKLLKCIQAKINEDMEDGNLAVHGVWIEGIHRGIVVLNQALGAE